MKTNKMKNKIAELTAIGMLVSMGSLSTAFAQADRGGNGGKGALAQFEFNTGQIQAWLERGNLQKVNLTAIIPGIDSIKLAVDVIEKAKRVLDHSIKLEFVDDEQRVGNEVRTCKNFQSLNLIRCNTARWNNDETPESRYLLTMHELISIAGYENNDGVASEYKISSKLLPYVAPATTYVLVDDPQQTKTYFPGIQCEFKQESTTLKKYRKIILQAHEHGARLIIGEGITDTRYAIDEILTKFRGYGVMRGLQTFNKMESANDDGSFIRFSPDGLTASGMFKLELSAKDSIALEVDVFDKVNRNPNVYLFIKEDGKLTGYNTQENCQMVNFDTLSFSTSRGVAYGESWMYGKEKEAFTKKSIRWLGSISDKNDYLSEKTRAPKI